jgi:hypothetical protein
MAKDANKLGEEGKKESPGRDDGPLSHLSTKEAIDREPKVKILIPSTDAENEINPVVLQNGGHAIQIMRDQPVSVAISWLLILNNAVMMTYKQVPRKEGEGYELVAIPALRFPYQILSALPEGFNERR